MLFGQDRNLMTLSMPFIEGRGRNFCRGCSAGDLFSALDLGDLPIANELWQNQVEDVEVFPLHLRICGSCGLGQVEDVVTPTRLFRDYRYLSSISSSFSQHAEDYAHRISEEFPFTKDDWVLEIASNDGYLLKNFVAMGISVLGIEPAENIAKIAVDNGIPTISEFFGTKLARELVESRGYPRFIMANNVMAHVPDLCDFMNGLQTMAGPNTVITVENPSLMNFLEYDQFDSIYHEHYSYLTAHSVKSIGSKVGLELYKVEKIDTHGGSNRYWLRTGGTPSSNATEVDRCIQAELDLGLFDKNEWESFAARIGILIENFRAWLEKSHEEGKVVCGYGAAAKASTLLNSAKAKGAWMKAIADESPEKQSRFMPVEGIPIVSSQEVFNLKPSDIVIFPWNLSREIANKIKNQYGSDIRIWQAIPRLEQVT